MTNGLLTVRVYRPGVPVSWVIPKVASIRGARVRAPVQSHQFDRTFDVRADVDVYLPDTCQLMVHGDDYRHLTMVHGSHCYC